MAGSNKDIYIVSGDATSMQRPTVVRGGKTKTITIRPKPQKVSPLANRTSTTTKAPNTTNNPKSGKQNNSKGGKQNNSKGGIKNAPAPIPAPNKNKVQTEEGPEEFDVLPDAANLDAINAEYTKHIMYFDVHPETVHSVYGTADLKKIRMSLDEE